MAEAELLGETALVTGAAQGIGAAVASALACRGVTVAAADQRSEPLARLVEHARAQGWDMHGYTVDVSESAAVEEVVAQVEGTHGPIESLVNVAGVLRAGLVRDFADADWERIFAVNTSGVFHLSRAVSNRMVPRGRGSVVTVSSNAAGVPRHGMAAYAASKAAATQFTKSLGLELAEHGIRCNVVSPGPTDTDMQRSLWTDANGGRRVVEGSPEKYRIGIPLGRLADPADVAEAVVFLLSERAGHVTLQDLYVDGGTTPRV